MSPIARERLFGIEHAFDSPATALVLTMVVAVLLLVPIIFWFVARAVGADPGRLRNWWRRNLARLVLVALFALPILAGAFWAIVLVGLILAVVVYFIHF